MKQKNFLIKLFIHLTSLAPIVYFYSLAISDNLGGDPVESILHFTGIGALNLLLITLLMSPLTKRFKQPIFIQNRRLLGLYSFFYALCHVVSFLAFEVQFDWALFINEIIKRPFMVIGMIAFCLLALLAITSLNQLKKAMGKKWQQLHNGIYLIVLLVVWHFYWSVKSDISSPVMYLCFTIVVLALRFSRLKRLIWR